MTNNFKKTIFDVNFVVLDTETTGAGDDDRVIEVAMVRFKYGLSRSFSECCRVEYKDLKNINNFTDLSIGAKAESPQDGGIGLGTPGLENLTDVTGLTGKITDNTTKPNISSNLARFSRIHRELAKKEQIIPEITYQTPNPLAKIIGQDGEILFSNLLSDNSNNTPYNVELFSEMIMDDLEQTLIDPEIPIKPAASAVHYLVDSDLVGSPVMSEYQPKMVKYLENSIVCAHNAQFDLNKLPFIKNLSVCTLKLARLILPLGEVNSKGLPLTSHKVQEIRYWLGLEKIDTMGLAAHRAAADILVTGYVFKYLLDRYVLNGGNIYFDEFLKFLDQPVMIERMTWGKHKGKFFKEIEKDYLWWLLAEDDKKTKSTGTKWLDENLRRSIEYFLSAKRPHVALMT